jgi:hypothetical protein
MKSKIEKLLKIWTDRLLDLQLPDCYGPGLAGGIICPVCSRIHGRCADSVYGFMRMARITGDERYLDAAIRVQTWADNNVSEPDGSWLNDVAGSWKGITVFGAVSLGESLRLHGDLLPDDIRRKWENRLRCAADFLHDFMTINTGNINYPLTCSAALAVASLVLGESKYADKARALAHEGLEYFTENGILFGEGCPQNGLSRRGCRPVDLGYNIEESIPGMVLYARLMNDDVVLDLMEKAAHTHLEFMLPDGGWDNSWGTRNFKWTYWGSRTSDGCQAGLIMLSDRDPVFAKAALRNLELLESCTHDGILYGGPDVCHSGEQPCIHHTFCHVKTLAASLDWLDDNNIDSEDERVELPRERSDSIKHFNELDTWLAAEGPWRATITANDFQYNRLSGGHAGGGTLSMLYHMTHGTILTASMSMYQLEEPQNMARHRKETMPLTPRLELVDEGVTYASMFDNSCVVETDHSDEGEIFKVKGHLCSVDQKHPASGPVPFQLTYEINSAAVSIKINCEKAADNLLFRLPVISRSTDSIENLSESSMKVNRSTGSINVTANSEIFGSKDERIFNHVPGFEALPLFIKVSNNNSMLVISCSN